MASDFIFRCNSLKCRAELTQQAVVTTCSHVFCLACADELNLSRSDLAYRLCPACDTRLMNPDDAVVAQLNPSEDYKTSILSGLTPTIIMECAGRALAFYSYQASQEATYQAYLAKSLTEKYTQKSAQLENYILEANTEIQRLQAMVDSSQKVVAELENKNYELGVAYKDKTKAHQDIQLKYNSLKAQKMTADARVAASDDAEHTLHMTGHFATDHSRRPPSGRLSTFTQPNQDQSVNRLSTSMLDGIPSQSRRSRTTWPSCGQVLRDNMTGSAPSRHRTRLPIANNAPRRAGNLAADFHSTSQSGGFHRQPIQSLGGEARRNLAPAGFRLSAGAKFGGPRASRSASRSQSQMRDRSPNHITLN